MKHAVILGCMMLATAAVSVRAQSARGDIETAALYAAILRDIPDYYGERPIVVDPRVSAVSLRDGASVLEVWEHRLSDAVHSPVVLGLHEAIAGITYCTETPNRASCLRSAGHVHVMFGAPFVRGSVTTVDVTVSFRVVNNDNRFAIQTWRYTFESGPDGSTLRRESLAQGHGRLTEGR